MLHLFAAALAMLPIQWADGYEAEAIDSKCTPGYLLTCNSLQQIQLHCS